MLKSGISLRMHVIKEFDSCPYISAVRFYG